MSTIRLVLELLVIRDDDTIELCKQSASLRVNKAVADDGAIT